MSVAAIQPPAVVYHEEQFFDWWIYAAMGVMEALAWLTLAWWFRQPPVDAGSGWGLEIPLGAAVGLVLPPVLLVGVLRMTTQVTPSMVVVWFGWVPTYKRSIALESIRKVEVVQFRPLAEHGGWGVRSTRDGERALTARGDRGVRLTLVDGSGLVIGSQTPELLAGSIDAAITPSA